MNIAPQGVRDLLPAALPAQDRAARDLDDDRDREELRQRYYGLLQELRVLLPGVQVLVAFLLTAPFAARFSELDSVGRAAYGVSLMAGLIAVVAFVTPTALHRMGRRTSRSDRLLWAIRIARVGLAFMAVSLLSALFVVARLIYGTPTAAAGVGVVGSLVVVAWVVLPLSVGPHHRRLELPTSSPRCMS
jgi:hypothetical protein